MNKYTLLLIILAPSVAVMKVRAETGALPFGQIRAFTTDGCTKFPDGTMNEPTLWRHCCVVHDLRYWAGGSIDDRERADLELGQCVAKTGHPMIGTAMVNVVRVGGSPHLATPWRWGFGWERPRGYTVLTLEEAAFVRFFTPSDLALVPISK